MMPVRSNCGGRLFDLRIGRKKIVDRTSDLDKIKESLSLICPSINRGSSMYKVGQNYIEEVIWIHFVAQLKT